MFLVSVRDVLARVSEVFVEMPREDNPSKVLTINILPIVCGVLVTFILHTVK